MVERIRPAETGDLNRLVEIYNHYITETHVTFVYAGDIWVVEKDGGTAKRLSSPPGEELFPRFSPDGNCPAGARRCSTCCSSSSAWSPLEASP